MNIAGSDQRQDDLFSTDSLLAMGRSALKGLKGIENVYMQHAPHLSQTLENLFKGRLREASHPFIEGAGTNAGLQRPQDVIIFIIGGATFEEARTVALLNEASSNTSGATGSTSTPAGLRLLLGGTCIHNSSRSASHSKVRDRNSNGSYSSFVEMIKHAATSFPSSVYDPPAVPANNLPALNINLGGVNVSVGGNTTGVYRTSSDMGVGVQADGIRDGMKTLFGKVKQGVDQIRNS